MYRNLTEPVKTRILELAAEGLSTGAINLRVGYSRSTVYKFLRAAGIRPGKWGIGKAYQNLQGVRSKI